MDVPGVELFERNYHPHIRAFDYFSCFFVKSRTLSRAPPYGFYIDKCIRFLDAPGISEYGKHVDLPHVVFSEIIIY